MLDLYSISTIDSPDTKIPSHNCVPGPSKGLGSGRNTEFVSAHACLKSSFTYLSNTAPQNLRSFNPCSPLAFQYGPVWIFSRKNRLSIIRSPNQAVVKC